MALRRQGLERKPAQTLLDPFCGSGTGLVEAMDVGFTATGVDLNPIAVELARIKTYATTDKRRAAIVSVAEQIAERALAAGKAARRQNAKFDRPGQDKPSERRRGGRRPDTRDADARRNRQLAQFFAPHIRQELEFLRAAITEAGHEDAELQRVLIMCLSATLYKVSKRKSDSDPRPVERKVARGAPSRLFRDRVRQLAEGLAGFPAKTKRPRVIRGDARNLSGLGIKDASIDCILTSPPYPGTYDYAEFQKLRMCFLGLDEIIKGEIGTRSSFQGDSEELRAASRQWRQDFRRCFKAMAAALKPGGMAILVQGDSIAGTRKQLAFEQVKKASDGLLDIHAWASQTRPKVTQAEKRAFADSAKREYIFALTK